MKCDVGDWTYIEDGLPEFLTGPYWVACRAKDRSRENWVGTCIIYSPSIGTKNLWGIPILDNPNFEAYAWMNKWFPEPPEECE